MEKSIFAELSKRIRESGEISAAAIPDMEMYMEQLLAFLNQRLEPLADKPDSQAFTKTMINNYTKDRVLIPPKNKKYSKQHVLLLILIYNLKEILSINEIKQLFSPVLRDITRDDDDLLPLEAIYNTYLDLMNRDLDEYSETFIKKLAFIGDATANVEGEENVHVAKLFLSVLVLTAQASLSKKIASLLIKRYFPAVAAEAGEAVYDIDLDAVFGHPPQNAE